MPPAPVSERRYTLPKAYALKQRRLIRSLFDRRNPATHSLAYGSVRLLYRVVPRSELRVDLPLQVGFAPGRRTRTAVARNRIKRIMREVYRREQHPLIDLFVASEDALILMILFRGDPSSHVMQLPSDVREALHRLIVRIQRTQAESG